MTGAAGETRKDSTGCTCKGAVQLIVTVKQLPLMVCLQLTGRHQLSQALLVRLERQ